VSIPRAATVSAKETQVIQVFSCYGDQPNSFRSVQRICTFLTQEEFRAKLRSKKLQVLALDTRILHCLVPHLIGSLPQGRGVAERYEKCKKVPIDVRVYDISYTLVKRPSGVAGLT
jgi:hypothetical protein